MDSGFQSSDFGLPHMGGLVCLRCRNYFVSNSSLQTIYYLKEKRTATASKENPVNSMIQYLER